MKNKHLICLFFCMWTWGLTAQGIQTFAEGSEIKVEGSSTVSDWSVAVKQVEGKLTLGEGFTGKLNDKIQDILIVMEVKSMEGRGPDMNEKIYKAFKADENPQIIFEASESICSEVQDEEFTLTSTGQLKMAGQNQEISLTLKGKSTDKGYVFTGSHKLDMTTYEMEPPTAFFGSLEVNKNVTVVFNILINT